MIHFDLKSLSVKEGKEKQQQQQREQQNKKGRSIGRME